MKEVGFNLNKGVWRRYQATLRTCGYGETFTFDHAMICHVGVCNSPP